MSSLNITPILFLLLVNIYHFNIYFNLMLITNSLQDTEINIQSKRKIINSPSDIRNTPICS